MKTPVKQHSTKYKLKKKTKSDHKKKHVHTLVLLNIGRIPLIKINSC